MDEIYYTVYRITNKINGKIYIGTHKTRNLDDGYMGSGTYLKLALKQYGLENFKKEILFTFKTPEEMYAKEMEIVNKDFLVTEHTYNLVVGGSGGFCILKEDSVFNYKSIPEFAKICSQKGLEGRQKRLKELRNDSEWCKKVSTSISDGLRSYYKNGGKGAFLGKTHTEATKKKISESVKGTRDGERNSQHGTMWITDGINNKKIKNDKLIPDGWYKGRKLRHK